MPHNLQIKAVQLDLARQMESIDFIKQFIDFSAQNNYNTLFLYLEWRVRCNAVDIGEGNGYSKEELKDIIDYAAQYNIDVIPGLAAIGHSELLLANEKFAHLNELYPDRLGKFKSYNINDLCPANPQVRQLLEAYFTEVAELFPSNYIHAGCDEAWEAGNCSRCKAVGNAEYIFTEHIKFCHDIISGKLKKRMMIWDDMFEFFPEIPEKLPKDIILVNWQYQENVTDYQGHFSNLSFCDANSRYTKLGFDYIFAPAEYFFSNIDSITDYNRSRNPYGALLTIWEKAESLMFRFLPNISVAGKLWNHQAQNAEEALKQTAAELFGIKNDDFINALQLSLNGTRISGVSENTLLANSIKGIEPRLLPSLQLQQCTLKKYVSCTKNALAELILSELIDACETKILYWRSIKAFSAMLNNMSYENPDNIIADLNELKERQINKFMQYRRPCDAEKIKNFFEKWQNTIKTTKDKLAVSVQLKVLFCLPEIYGAAQTEIYAKTGDTYKYLTGGCFKCDESNLYFRTFLLPADSDFDTLKFEVSGFGGQGICYAEIRRKDCTLIPEKVISSSGEISNSQNILFNDASVCYLGHNRILDVYNNDKYKDVSSVELKFKKTF